MISVTELRAGTVFEEEGKYFLVLSYEHIKMARGSGNVKVKVRNLETGANIERSFITGAKVQDVSLQRRRVQFLYSDSEVHVMDMETYEQFALGKKVVGDMQKYLKEGMEVLLYSADGKPLYVEMPKIIDFKVEQTGGSAKGTSVGATYKDAVLENGLVVKVPLFIKTGEVIRVDTRNGDYVERAK